MQKTNKNKNVEPDIDGSVLFYEEIDNTDIRRVVAKMLKTFTLGSMPAIARTINVEGIEPSNLNVFDCNRILMEYSKAHVENMHPASVLEIVRETNALIFEDSGIRVLPDDYKPKDVNELMARPVKLLENGVATDSDIKLSKMGAIICNAHQSQIANVSTLLAYTTKEDDDSNIKSVFSGSKYAKFLNIPQNDFSNARSMVRTYEKNHTISQHVIYSKLMANFCGGLSVVHITYKSILNFSKCDKVNTPAVNHYRLQEAKRLGKKIKVNNDEMTYYPAVSVPSYQPEDEVLQSTCKTAWVTSIVSQAARGGDRKGIGALTIGYYNFEMSSHYYKSISRAREIIAILNLLTLRVVKIPVASNDFTAFLNDILVANGITVISDNAVGKYSVDSPPGVYAVTEVQVLRIFRNSITVPTMEKKSGLTTDIRDFDNRMAQINSEHRSADLRAMYTYLTPQVEEYALKNKMSLYPTLSPHAVRVWIISSDISKIVPLPSSSDIYLSSVRANHCRNLFPFSRHTFYRTYKFREYFARAIIIPKIYRKIDKTEIITMPPSYNISKESFSMLPAEVEDGVKASLIVNVDQQEMFSMFSTYSYLDPPSRKTFFLDLYKRRDHTSRITEMMKNYSDYREFTVAYEQFCVYMEHQNNERIARVDEYREQFVPPPVVPITISQPVDMSNQRNEADFNDDDEEEVPFDEEAVKQALEKTPTYTPLNK